MTLLLGAPALLAALVVGALVGIGQAVTQLQEPVLGLAARLVAVLVVVLAVLPWMISVWRGYAVELIGSLPVLVRG